MNNFFKIFGFPEIFAIDLEILEKKYLDFQSSFHPDKTDIEDISKSIIINEAYNVLSDDFLRACHLLEIRNIDLQSDEKSIKVDNSTLQEILELQEKIIEIENKSDLDELEAQLKKQIKELLSAFNKAFESNDIKTSAQYLIKAKYLKKSVQDIKIKKQKIS